MPLFNRPHSAAVDLRVTMPKCHLLMPQATYHQEQSTPNLGAKIVEEIADREGTSPIQLSPPLYSVIDPDALNSLFQSTASADLDREGSVCFTYCGYNVHVDSNANITAESIDGTE